MKAQEKAIHKEAQTSKEAKEEGTKSKGRRKHIQGELPYLDTE